MKLYTEKTLIKYILDDGFIEIDDFENNLISSIELPSDDEIEKEALEENNDDLSPAEEFQRGAKWYREQITKTK